MKTNKTNLEKTLCLNGWPLTKTKVCLKMWRLGWHIHYKVAFLATEGPNYPNEPLEPICPMSPLFPFAPFKPDHLGRLFNISLWTCFPRGSDIWWDGSTSPSISFDGPVSPFCPMSPISPENPNVPFTFVSSIHLYKVKYLDNTKFQTDIMK
jgi:hypothetical protein